MSDEQQQRKSGEFTLVEAIGGLVVLAVLVVLVAFAFARGQKNGELAKRNNCLGQLRCIALSLKAYSNDDIVDQFFPYTSNAKDSNALFLETLVTREYIKDIKVFVCPSDRRGKWWPTGAGSSSITGEGFNSYSVVYSFDPNIKATLKDDGGTDTPILADALGAKNPHRGEGQNVFFSDGHGLWMITVPPFPNPNNPKKVWLNPKGIEAEGGGMRAET